MLKKGNTTVLNHQGGECCDAVSAARGRVERSDIVRAHKSTRTMPVRGRTETGSSIYFIYNCHKKLPRQPCYPTCM